MNTLRCIHRGVAIPPQLEDNPSIWPTNSSWTCAINKTTPSTARRVTISYDQMKYAATRPEESWVSEVEPLCIVVLMLILEEVELVRHSVIAVVGRPVHL